MKTDKSPAGKLPVFSEKQSLKQIRKLHGAIIHAAKTSLDSAIILGELLTKVRAKIQHGEWESWAERNLPFDVRTARNYIRCFEERDRLKTETVSDLTSAYKFLSVSEPAAAPASNHDVAEPASNDQSVLLLSIRDLDGLNKLSDAELDAEMSLCDYLRLPIRNSEDDLARAEANLILAHFGQRNPVTPRGLLNFHSEMEAVRERDALEGVAA